MIASWDGKRLEHGHRTALQVMSKHQSALVPCGGVLTTVSADKANRGSWTNSAEGPIETAAAACWWTEIDCCFGGSARVDLESLVGLGL